MPSGIKEGFFSILEPYRKRRGWVGGVRQQGMGGGRQPCPAEIPVCALLLGRRHNHFLLLGQRDNVQTLQVAVLSWHSPAFWVFCTYASFHSFFTHAQRNLLMILWEASNIVLIRLSGQITKSLLPIWRYILYIILYIIYSPLENIYFNLEILSIYLSHGS